jgi:NAD(P)-dependent dehydrogenase (short-subunit alcohol dehydrogenase family)
MAEFPKRPRAVVTGAGSGLGRAICLQLARQKARILIADVNLPAAKETAVLVAEAGGEGVPFKCDVTKLSNHERAAAEMDRRWKGTDILVNNAGVASGGFVGEIPISDWEWIMKINLWGVIYGCHVFVPKMKKKKRGWIINVASTAGIASLPEMASYNVTKAGVISLSETMAVELSPYNIGVTTLCPTYFRTNLMESFRSVTQRQRNISQAFFNRAQATADDVAAAGLAGVQKGELIVIPQADGQNVWKAKRSDPELYFQKLKDQVSGGVFHKLANEGGTQRKPSK